MAKPTNIATHAYQFTDDIKFFQKAVVMHPTENTFCIIKRSETESSRPGTWDLPGGNVLYGEENYAALKREIFEETGLRVGMLKEVKLTTRYFPDIPMYYFVLGAIGKAPSDSVKLSKEHTAYRWVTKEEFIAMDPNYIYKEKRLFDPNSTDFLRDIVYEAFSKI